MPKQYKQNGIQLWVWLNCQHRKAKQGKLSAEQLKKLGEIDFFETTPRYRTWEDSFLKAKQYYEENGNLDIPRDYENEDGLCLGKWVEEQRRRLRRGALTVEQIERLDAIEMRWDDPRKTRWYVYLEAVRGYPRKANGVPIVPAGELSEFGAMLKTWVQHQDDNYKKGRLDATQRMRWEEMISEAVSLPARHEDARHRPTVSATL